MSWLNSLKSGFSSLMYANENDPSTNLYGSKMNALNLMSPNERERINSVVTAYRGYRNSPNNTMKRNNAKRMYKNLNPTNKGYFRLLLNENEKNMLNILNRNTNNNNASDPGSPRSVASSLSTVNSPSSFFKNMPQNNSNAARTFKAGPASRFNYSTSGNSNAANVFSKAARTSTPTQLAENVFSTPALRGGKLKSRKASRRRMTRRMTRGTR